MKILWLLVMGLAKKKAAFCAKEVLKKEANIVIDKKDLTLILDKV